MEDSPGNIRFNRGRNRTSKDIGSFEVICGGKAVCPGSWAGSVLSWVLILVPSALQIVFINQQFPLWYLLDLAYILTMALSLGCLLLTTLTDPGVIPRGTKDALLSPQDLGISISP